MLVRWTVAVAFLAPLGLHADRVVFDLGDGSQRTEVGAIVSEDSGYVVIEYDFDHRLRIATSRVKEVVRDAHPVIDCRDKYRTAEEANTADAWLELAGFAKENDLQHYEEEAYSRTLDVDPQNTEAHRGLGHVKVNGRWVTAKEARRAKQWTKKVGDMQREFSGRDWATIKPIKTKYFELKCGSTEEVEKQYEAFLQNALFPLYNKLFPPSKFTWHNEEPGTIYIMANVEQFRDFSGAPMGVGGFFIPPRNVVYAFHGSFGIRGTTLHVLAHEACHVYQWRIFKEMMAVPTWLLEGMAVYFGDGAEFGFSFRDDPREFRSDAVQIVPPYDRVLLLKRMVRSTSVYVPLEKLLVVPKMAFGAALYSNAWLVNFWCLDGEKYGAHTGEGRALLDEYILHVSTLTNKKGTFDARHLKSEADYFAGLVKKHLGRSLGNWDDELKRFVQELPLPQLGVWNDSSKRWKGQGLQLRCPSGLTIVDPQDLLPGEVVAFGPRVGDQPRITVWTRSNDFLVRIGENQKGLLKRWIRELYAVEAKGWIKDPQLVKTASGGMVEAILRGKRNVRVLPGEKMPKERPTRTVRFRATATPSKVYFFACESPPNSFESNDEKYFEYFLKNVELSE